MDKTLVLVAAISAVPPTLVALISLFQNRKNSKQIEEVHLSINSRMTELLSSSNAVSKAQGVEEGRAETK